MRAQVLVALIALCLCGGVAACIDRTTGSGPHSTALTRLRHLGVPPRFNDALLVRLVSETCDMPPGTRASEFDPGIFRQLAAAGIEIDASSAALVEILFASGPGLCDPTASPAPTSSPATPGTVFDDVTASLESERTNLLEGAWLTLTQLANPRLSVPSPGVLRIEAEAPAGTESSAACTAVIVLGSLYSFFLTPLELALLTGDPDPVVQIAIDGADQVDSGPDGLSALSQQCFGVE